MVMPEMDGLQLLAWLRPPRSGRSGDHGDGDARRLHGARSHPPRRLRLHPQALRERPAFPERPPRASSIAAWCWKIAITSATWKSWWKSAPRSCADALQPARAVLRRDAGGAGRRAGPERRRDRGPLQARDGLHHRHRQGHEDRIRRCCRRLRAPLSCTTSERWPFPIASCASPAR